MVEQPSLAASSDPDTRLRCLYKTQTQSIRPGDGKRLSVILETAEGPLEIHADRIISRLGAIPPRDFVEAAGVVFPNAKPEAIPELSRQYESNVEGLYIIGSLAGYPLIKQAMNQGYEVVEYIRGNRVENRQRQESSIGYNIDPLPSSPSCRR